MKKNVGSQSIGVQMIVATTGAAFTGTVTAYVTGDAGTQAVGGTASGATASEGNGYYTYVPTQAETNYDLIAFTFIGTLAIPVTLQVFTTFPQTVDNDVLAQTTNGVVDTILVDTAEIGTAGAGLTDITINAASVDLIMDEPLTGGTHNVATSLGRRMRGLQEFQGYEGGAVWIDTVRGSTGTTDYEFGTAENPVATIAEAITIASSVNLARFEYAPNSSVTLTASISDEVHRGIGWHIALGGQDVTGGHIMGAHGVSGTCTATGTFMFEDCIFNAVTLPAAGYVHETAFKGVVTLGEVGAYHFHGCFTDSTTGSTIDFGVLGAQTVYIHGWDGKLTIKNMASGDNVHISGGGQIITETCTGGQIHPNGHFIYTDAGGNVTVLLSDLMVNVNSILTDTGTTIPATLDSMKGATFSTSTDSLEAIRDRGDSAWTTGAGGSSPTVVQIREEMDSNSTKLTAIVADTNELQTDDVPTLISALDAVVDTVKAETALIVADTNELQSDNIPATLASLATSASIAAIDVLIDSIIAELVTAAGEPAQGAPAASLSSADKISFLYKAWRNKTTQTSTTLSVFDDAGTTVDHKLTVSDDGTTATRGEVVTGP